MKQFVATFASNVINCFKGRMLIWHVIAILLTLVLVQSGFDWWYFKITHTPEIRRLMFPAVRVGFYLPIWSPIILFLVGFTVSNGKIVRSGWALLQAELIGLFISSGYKAITGRAHPLHNIDRDISHVFQFGFMRGGVFWGWPSSHTTIAFAMAFTIVTLFPKCRWLSAVVILYALYVGLGVSMTIHWFSDFAAGAIIGTVIGIIVGRSFSTDTRTIS
jgi:membrane-associated phospholipid phosphatase